MYAKVKSATAIAVLMAGTFASPAALAQGSNAGTMPGADGQTQEQMMSGGNHGGQSGNKGMGGAMGGMGGQNGGMGQMMMMQMMMQNMQMMMQNMQNMGAGQNGMGSGMGGNLGGDMGAMGGQSGAQGMWADKSPEDMQNFLMQMPDEQRQMLLEMLQEMGDE